MLNQTEFNRLLRRDKAPEKGAPLRKQFEENPKLLVGEVSHSFHPVFSVIFLAISLGSLHIADCILKSDGNQFGANVDPFYLAKDCLNLEALPESAGVNFYLALTALQYYSQKNKLSELVSETESDSLVINLTYYDKLYWENKNNEVFYTSKQPNTSERHTFMRAQAEWFMRFSYEVFHLEAQLNEIALEAKSAWFSSWRTSSSNNAQKIHALLGEHYLHIAYMETSSETAFFYFIKKANNHYALSSNDYRNVHNQLSELLDRITSDPDQVWRETFRNQYASLRECGIATKDFFTNATVAWNKAFNFAHESIMNQGIPSSLHFMDTDSARTSSTERNSQGSGEPHEAKKADSSIVDAGLHRRHNGLGITLNPLLQPYK